jgi:hypothetical protein
VLLSSQAGSSPCSPWMDPGGERSRLNTSTTAYLNISLFAQPMPQLISICSISGYVGRAHGCGSDSAFGPSLDSFRDLR